MDEELDAPPEDQPTRLSRRSALSALAGGLAVTAATAVPAAADDLEFQTLSPDAKRGRSGRRLQPEAFTRSAIATLNSGLVIVTGGYHTGPIALTRIYNPTTGIWTEAAPLNEARFFHTAVTLPDGRVLVAGGFHLGAIASAEIYEPGRDRWVTVAPMNQPRYHHAATGIGPQVLVAGGWHIGPIATLEIYYSRADQWRFAKQ